MSYFDVYLKRVNRYGNNLQERIQGKKEHDFEVFMSKSPNKVTAWNNRIGLEEDGYSAVLQTKEYDQDEVVDYLLVPLEQEIAMGTIIYTFNKRHDNIEYEDKKNPGYRRWINYAIDPYTSTGYNRYTVVELESELSWVVDGIKYTSFAHATGGGSGARDKNINLKFKVQFSEAGAYLPNKRYSIVMPTNKHLKKNMKVTLGGETWRVAGFDNISVKGVSYVTLEETLTDEREDIPIANHSELKNWAITTSLGKDFVIPITATTLDLIFYYKNEIVEDVSFSVLENEDYFAEINGKSVTITAKTRNLGKSSLKIIIGSWTEGDFIEIPFSFGSVSGLESAILGADIIYMGEVKEYIITNTSQEETDLIKLSDNYAKIISKTFDEQNNQTTLKIEGIKIGTVTIEMGDYKFPIKVQSAWLGGN